MKKSVAVFFSLLIFASALFGSFPSYAADFEIGEDIPSAIIVEKDTGTVLYEKDPDTPRLPASVTKVMTMLLIMEALDSGKITYEDPVTVSAYAASMGGSQVYLKEGEQMSVSDMLKCIAVASANDACVAMAEHIAGSESAFVEMMNSRAAELGMVNTHFQNTNGLDDTATEHYTSARDISIMSRELLKHERILEYSSIWMDSVRGGTFGLTNTNRLVRFYEGANGLKTGSTSKAGFCISATAQRDGMTLICVIMGAPTKDSRNEAAKSAFNYGFANYALYKAEPVLIETVPVKRGTSSTCTLKSEGVEFLIPKGAQDSVKIDASYPDSLVAPLSRERDVGSVSYSVGDSVLAESRLFPAEDVGEIGFGSIFITLLNKLFIKSSSAFSKNSAILALVTDSSGSVYRSKKPEL